jgi:ADP-ribose pyrophosphatase
MDDERIVTRWFKKEEVADWIHEGKILDGKTIVGYFTWLDKQRRVTRS